jgi:hypothetical protein
MAERYQMRRGDVTRREVRRRKCLLWVESGDRQL